MKRTSSTTSIPTGSPYLYPKETIDTDIRDPAAVPSTAAVTTSRSSWTVSVVVSITRSARSRISASLRRSARILSATVAPLAAIGCGRRLSE